jgi:hypothetical protein
VGVLILAGTPLSTGFMLASGAVVGTLPQAVRAGWSSAAGHRLIGLLVAVGVLFVLMQALEPCQTALAETLGRRIEGRLRLRTMRAALAPDGIAHLEDPVLLDRVGKTTTGPAGLSREPARGTWSETPDGSTVPITLYQRRVRPPCAAQMQRVAR